MCMRIRKTRDFSKTRKGYDQLNLDTTTTLTQSASGDDEELGIQNPKIPVITAAEPRKIQSFIWGFTPTWAKRSTDSIIHVRIETAEQKFPHWFQNRCVVLLDGFYEHQKLTEEEKKAKKKQDKYHIRSHSGEPLAVAGIWREEMLPSGERKKIVLILTTDSQGTMAPIHSRMPVILKPESEKFYLENDIRFLRQDLNKHLQSELHAMTIFAPPPTPKVSIKQSNLFN